MQTIKIPQLLILLIIGVCISLLVSCKTENQRPTYYEMSESDEVEYSACETSEYTIPFTEKGGVKFVDVKVNGIGFEMIFDTGCSATLISVAEANYLYQKGLLTADDILGKSSSQIADGSIVVNTVVRLREVIIADKIFAPDVTATVSNNVNAPLLLGNEVLDRLATITIDNDMQTIHFKLREE